MGTQIIKKSITNREVNWFSQVLHSETELLKKWTEEKFFSEQKKEIGFELEFYLLDKSLKPDPSNLQFIKDLDNPHFVFELVKSCFELNSSHFPLNGKAFSLHENDFNHFIKQCNEEASKQNKNFIYIGALPTRNVQAFSKRSLVNEPRFHLLEQVMSYYRDGLPIQFNIHGEEDQLDLTSNSIAIGGTVSAFQIHLQVGLSESARFYNAAQIAAGPVLAIGANSPSIFGKNLWSESRIPFFEQLFQMSKNQEKNNSPRVLFGHRYLNDSMLELFSENLNHFHPYLPHFKSVPEEEMFHLRLHNGTIYRWNRPVLGFDDKAIPHFRIETRFLSAGPTIVDMCANSAFFCGLVQFIATKKASLEQELSFLNTKENFYQAARNGIKSDLYWVDNKKTNARELILHVLLPMAEEGLNQLQVDSEDIKFYLSIIKGRAETMQTGSVWQNRFLEKHDDDLTLLKQFYIENQAHGNPVHEWPI